MEKSKKEKFVNKTFFEAYQKKKWNKKISSCNFHLSLKALNLFEKIKSQKSLLVASSSKCLQTSNYYTHEKIYYMPRAIRGWKKDLKAFYCN